MNDRLETEPEEERPLHVCVIGHHELDYPRNVCVQAWLKQAGFRQTLCHSRVTPPLRTLVLLVRSAWSARKVDVMLVTEGSHTHVPYLKLVAWFTRRPLIFDPFISRYNTRVEDRKLYAPGSWQARRAALQDWAACRFADVLLFDTVEHQEYFASRYHFRCPSHVLEIGVDETVFRPGPARKPPPADTLRVLFYGTFIPLQGIEHIVRAAKELEHHPAIRIRIVGTGQTYAEVRALAARLNPTNLEFCAPLAPTDLAKEILTADVCLGIFGEGPKPGQVVPNKVVQCAASARPVVTRRSSSIERYFKHGESVYLVEPANGAALARALDDLANSPGLRERLARGARAVFEQHFSSAVQATKLAKIIRSTVAKSARGGARFGRPPLAKP